MWIIIGCAIVVALISFWDLIKLTDVTQLLQQRKIELLVLIAGLDLAKGYLLFSIAQYSNLSNIELYLIGLIMLVCSTCRWMRYRTLVQFIPTLGFLWPLMPHFFNTLLVLFLVSLYFTRRLSLTAKHIAFVLPFSIFFFWSNPKLAVAVGALTLFICGYLAQFETKICEKKCYQEPGFRIYLG